MIMGYDYKMMTDNLKKIQESFTGIKLESIGKSVMDRDIFVSRIGKGEKKVLLAGAYHGLEYISAAFLVRFLREYAHCMQEDKEMFGYKVKKLCEKTTLYIIPMVNPDGVDIAIHGLDITNPHHRRLISEVGIHSFNSVWQANARGVDINHNFDASWQMTVERPAPTKYGGEYPESECETKAVAEFIRKEKPDIIAAFHSQGREIYYDFDGMTAMRSEEIAEKMAKESGYAVKRPVGSAAYGGCKDWFIKEFGKEGFTIEMGSGKNPLPDSALDEIFEENARMALCIMEEI